MLEKRKLIADIDIDELLKNDSVANYSRGDTEEAYIAALQIFERFCSVTAQYSIIDVDWGGDTYLLLLVYQGFDINEEILGPDKSRVENFAKRMEEIEQEKYSEVDETLFEPYQPSTDPDQIKRINKMFEEAAKLPEIQDDWSY